MAGISSLAPMRSWVKEKRTDFGLAHVGGVLGPCLGHAGVEGGGKGTAQAPLYINLRCRLSVSRESRVRDLSSLEPAYPLGQAMGIIMRETDVQLPGQLFLLIWSLSLEIPPVSSSHQLLASSDHIAPRLIWSLGILV